MKHVLFFTFILTTFFLHAQTPGWTDNINYSVICPDPIEDNTIAPWDENFEYSVNFNAEFNQSNQSGYITRIATFKIIDEDGDVEFQFNDHQDLFHEDGSINLNCGVLSILEADMEYTVELSFCYKMNSNFLGIKHTLHIVENGFQYPPIFTSIEEGIFHCFSSTTVFCFKTPACSETDMHITLGNNDLLTADVPVCPDLDPYTYSWIFKTDIPGEGDDPENERTIVGDDSLTGQYCVTVTNIFTGCVYEDCYDWLSQVDPNCEIPPATGLMYSYDIFNNVIFTWDTVPGAESYVVEILINDPECCPGQQNETNQIRIPTTKTFVKYGGPKDTQLSCFSWSVKAICEPLGGSSSEKQCGGFISKFNNDDHIETRNINKLETHLEVFPNPTTATSTITVSGLEDDSALITIYSIEGELISSEKVTSTLDQHTIVKEIGQGLESGLYIINVTSETVNLSKKLIIQK